MLSNALTTAALVLGSTSLLVNAQATSNATCIPQYSWMLNSLGQTPCLVSAYVSGVCDAGTWNVPALTSTLYPYNSPSGSGVNDCRCNTVEYQLISACTVCQGGTAPSTWASWVQNCPATEVNIKLFPHTVPQGTAIPAWAYIDSTTTNNGLFDPTAAKALINKPDVAAGTQPSITPGANVPTVTFVPGASVTQTATSGVKKSSSNTGAIVGGIIGGLALLLLIGLAIFLLMRRSNGGAKMQASPQYAAPPVPVATPGAYDHYNFAPPMAGPNAPQMGAAYPSTPSSQPGELYYPGTPAMTPYNGPGGPGQPAHNGSTYHPGGAPYTPPPAQGQQFPPQMHQAQGYQEYQGSMGYQQQQQHPHAGPGAYSGAAEI